MVAYGNCICGLTPAGRRALVTIVGTRGQGSDGGRHGSSLRDATWTLHTIH